MLYVKVLLSMTLVDFPSFLWPPADHTCVFCPPCPQTISRPHNRHARGFCLLSFLFPSPSCAFLQCPRLNPPRSTRPVHPFHPPFIPFCPQSLSWLQLRSPVSLWQTHITVTSTDFTLQLNIPCFLKRSQAFEADELGFKSQVSNELSLIPSQWVNFSQV